MADNKNRVLWSFFADTKNLEKGLKRSEKGFKSTEKQTTKMGSALGGVKSAALAVGATFGAMELARWAGDAIQLASAAAEVDSKFEAVFGAATDFNEALIAWADQAGVADAKARDMIATFGNLAMAQGISMEDTKTLAADTATLAGDLASFNDADPEQVFKDLNTAMLTGEREGMKKYGIALLESEIKQRALEIAVADGRTEFTKADKTLATYQLAVEQSGKAVGDLERTSDSLANKERQLTADIEDQQTAIGQELLPLYSDFLSISADLIPVLGGVAGEIGEMVGAYGDLKEAIAIVSGNSEGGIGDLTQAATTFGVYISTKFNPLMWATDAALKAVGREGFAEMAQGAADAKPSIEEIAEATQTYRDDMWEAQGAAEDLIGAVDGLGASADITSGKLRDMPTLEDLENRASLVGGGSGGSSDKYFATGTSRVPGPTGKPTIATVHGGETITPAGMGGGGGNTYVLNVTAIDPASAAEAVADAIRFYESTNGSIRE